MKHQGGCHCGAVRFEVETQIQSLMTCNCSICRRRGHMLTFVPVGAFQLLSGQAQLTDYTFNKNLIHHPFCKVCGVGSFGRGVSPKGEEMVAVNARCLDNFDLSSVSSTEYDGRSL